VDFKARNQLPIISCNYLTLDNNGNTTEQYRKYLDISGMPTIQIGRRLIVTLFFSFVTSTELVGLTEMTHSVKPRQVNIWHISHSERSERDVFYLMVVPDVDYMVLMADK